MTQSRSICLLGCIAMLAACSSVRTLPGPREERQIAKAFLDAVRPFHAALPMPLADGEPQPAQLLAESQVRVTVEGHLSAVQTRDGSWIVQVPANGSARITAYSTTDGLSGAALNVRGTNQADIHTQQLVLPLFVVPGDALVVTSTATGSRDAYWPVPGRSAIDEAMAVVFVSYPAIPGLLRPPAIGDGFLARLLRSEPIPEAMVNMSRLPNVIDVDSLPVSWAAWGAAKPDFPYLVALLQPFGGECYDGWSTDTRTPDLQHPGYGSAYASIVSQALVMLCSTAPTAQKLPLALAVTQRGLDLVGAFCDGRLNYPSGGHMQGRKALIVACGHLLGIVPIADPVTYIGPRFQEDGYFETTPSAWWFGAGWTAGWRFELPSPFDGSQLHNPPSTWGPVAAPAHDSWAWMVNGYMSTVLGSQVGTALAMHLMGREREMGTAFYRMIHEWMYAPPSAAQAQISAVGIVLTWRTDYALVRGAGFCRAAWIAAGL
jgi:hypothetical protein